jgi:nicotinate phosphoribosyltransferase
VHSTSRALLTDLYQLTMAQVYFELGMDDTAVFELFARRLPRTRRFLIAGGLAQAIEYLEQLRFAPAEIEYLASLGTFKPAFLDHLSELRFTGSLHAMREGTPFFADEPVLRITAPILEAQLVESRILNIVHFQTLIASKAARCVLAARGRQLVDFGMRRAHEGDAALYAARAAYLAGFHATATVEAGRRFGIPLSGTMAHSFIEAHERESDAFRNFVTRGPAPDATLLIDTYDTQRGARRVGLLVQELRKSSGSARVRAVRIDSGDLANEARSVRAILDEYDCEDIRIVLSGNLDEHVIDGLLRNGVPADAFGVGTALDVSTDTPALDVAYKLQQYGGKPRRKRSIGKATWPGTKQVFRERGEQGQLVGDRVVLVDEKASGEPLLIPLLAGGHRVGPLTPLSESREHCARELQGLPWPLRELGEAGEGERFPVVISDALRALAASVDAREA